MFLTCSNSKKSLLSASREATLPMRMKISEYSTVEVAIPAKAPTGMDGCGDRSKCALFAPMERERKGGGGRI